MGIVSWRVSVKQKVLHSHQEDSLLFISYQWQTESYLHTGWIRKGCMYLCSTWYFWCGEFIMCSTMRWTLFGIFFTILACVCCDQRSWEFRVLAYLLCVILPNQPHLTTHAHKPSITPLSYLCPSSRMNLISHSFTLTNKHRLLTSFNLVSAF